MDTLSFHESGLLLCLCNQCSTFGDWSIGLYFWGLKVAWFGDLLKKCLKEAQLVNCKRSGLAASVLEQGSGVPQGSTGGPQKSKSLFVYNTA